MPNTVVLEWNIKDLNPEQIGDKHMIKMICQVIHSEGATMVVILETKTDKGDLLGQRLVARLNALPGGVVWNHHASPKSARYSNKPENYVFVFQTGIWGANHTTGAFPVLPPDPISGKLRGFPHQHGNLRKHSPSRYPYIAKFTTTPVLNSRALTFVAYHAPFDVTTPECCLNLNLIPDVLADANVIVTGDFNEEPHHQRTYIHRLSYDDGLCHGGAFVRKIDYATDADLTTLKEGYVAGYTTLQARASLYDNFFLKAGGQIDTVTSTASVVDNLNNLTFGNYLHKYGRKVYNNAAGRRVAKGKAAGPVFGAADNIQDAEDAHEVHWNAVSDHLPIRLMLHVN